MCVDHYKIYIFLHFTERLSSERQIILTPPKIQEEELKQSSPCEALGQSSLASEKLKTEASWQCLLCALQRHLVSMKPTVDLCPLCSKVKLLMLTCLCGKRALSLSPQLPHSPWSSRSRSNCDYHLVQSSPTEQV